MDEQLIENERENFKRAHALILETGVKVCSEIFRKNCFTEVNRLARDEAKRLKSLRDGKIISKQQWEVLCPKKEAFDANKIDLTLYLLLIRNFCYLIQPTCGNWDVRQPNPCQTEVGDDIVRLTNLRNQYFAHIKAPRMATDTFKNIWSETEAVLLRLAKSVSVEFTKKIESDIEKTRLKEDIIVIKCSPKEVTEHGQFSSEYCFPDPDSEPEEIEAFSKMHLKKAFRYFKEQISIQPLADALEKHHENFGSLREKMSQIEVSNRLVAFCLCEILLMDDSKYSQSLQLLQDSMSLTLPVEQKTGGWKYFPQKIVSKKLQCCKRNLLETITCIEPVLSEHMFECKLLTTEEFLDSCLSKPTPERIDFLLRKICTNYGVLLVALKYQRKLSVIGALECMAWDQLNKILAQIRADEIPGIRLPYEHSSEEFLRANYMYLKDELPPEEWIKYLQEKKCLCEDDVKAMKELRLVDKPSKTSFILRRLLHHRVEDPNKFLIEFLQDSKYYGHVLRKLKTQTSVTAESKLALEKIYEAKLKWHFQSIPNNIQQENILQLYLDLYVELNILPLDNLKEYQDIVIGGLDAAEFKKLTMRYLPHSYYAIVYALSEGKEDYVNFLKELEPRQVNTNTLHIDVDIRTFPEIKGFKVRSNARLVIHLEPEVSNEVMGQLLTEEGRNAAEALIENKTNYSLTNVEEGSIILELEATTDGALDLLLNFIKTRGINEFLDKILGHDRYAEILEEGSSTINIVLKECSVKELKISEQVQMCRDYLLEQLDIVTLMPQLKSSELFTDDALEAMLFEKPVSRRQRVCRLLDAVLKLPEEHHIAFLAVLKSSNELKAFEIIQQQGTAVAPVIQTRKFDITLKPVEALVEDATGTQKDFKLEEMEVEEVYHVAPGSTKRHNQINQATDHQGSDMETGSNEEANNGHKISEAKSPSSMVRSLPVVVSVGSMLVRIVQVQSYCRGFLVRRWIQNRKLACIRIQSAIRSHLTRNNYLLAKLKEKKLEEMTEPQHMMKDQDVPVFCPTMLATETKHGIQKENKWLRIYFRPPEFKKQLCNSSVDEGDEVTMECHVTGTPRPVVEWYFKQQSMETIPWSHTTTVDGTCILSIQNTTYKNEGTYKCVARNEVGSVSTEAYLAVEGNL